MIDQRQLHLAYDQSSIEGLNSYLDERIEVLKESLITAQGNDIIGIQSSILELRKLKKLKEIILAKRDKNG